MKRINRNLTLALLALATTLAFAAERQAILADIDLNAGFHARGSAKSLLAGDDRRLEIRSVNPNGRHTIDWTATYQLDMSTLDKEESPNEIRVDVEANITPAQFIEIRAFNFQSGAWDFIEYQMLKSSDVRFTTLLDGAYASPDGKVALNFHAEGKRLMMLRTDMISVSMQVDD